MTISDISTIDPLLKHEGKVCISIYMSTHRGGREIQQDTVRLRNLIGQAATKLVQADVSTEKINEILAPASELLDQSDFCQQRSDGLALFLGQDFCQYYCVPIGFEEFVGVSPNFYIKPLLPFLNNNGVYYILAVSQNQVRVFQATRSSIEPLELETVPASLAEALKYDDPEKQLQFHSGRGGAPLYHGQGETNRKVDILRFFQAVDHGLQSSLEDACRPMVFVGVDYLFPLYREANSYPLLLEDSVATNPDTLHPQTLHQQTWPVAEAYFKQAAKQNKGRYRELVGSAYTADRLTDILNAAHDGQIETLFVASGYPKWGIYDAQTREFVVDESNGFNSDGLLNLAAIYTLNCGGQVFIMDTADMPTNTRAAAILRYPMPSKMATAV
ncbi:MAG: hypothetical protein AAGI69_05310 [Cyanobacteria bacterium P01_H01_bin.21]